MQLQPEYVTFGQLTSPKKCTFKCGLIERIVVSDS